MTGNKVESKVGTGKTVKEKLIILVCVFRGRIAMIQSTAVVSVLFRLFAF